jgi:hypothetical protein
LNHRHKISPLGWQGVAAKKYPRQCHDSHNRSDRYKDVARNCYQGLSRLLDATTIAALSCSLKELLSNLLSDDGAISVDLVMKFSIG